MISKLLSHIRRCTRLLSALLLLLTACVQAPVQEFETDCPEPVIECLPGSWTAAPFDTAYVGPGQYHLKIDPIRGLNTPGGEFSLAFSSSSNALLTRGDAAMQSLGSVQLSSAADAKYLNNLDLSEMGSYGSGSVRPFPIFSGVDRESVTGDADIFLADIQANSLGNVQKVSALNTPLWWDGHPTLSPSGDIVIFASERPSALGGTDLWYSIRTNGGNWSAVQSGGAGLNTICDEPSPFISFDGRTLLFASAGHETIGGYDIFACTLDLEALRAGDNKRAFGPVLNVGAPLNTAADELFPSTPAGHDTLLYYSSNQNSPAGTPVAEQGGFDLYVLHRVIRRPEAITALSTIKPREVLRGPEQREPSRASGVDKPVAVDSNVPKPDSVKIDLDEPSTPDSQRIKVEGRVIDKTSKQPIKDAVVTMKEVPEGRVRDSTTTNAEGEFELEGDVTGKVEISAQAEDFFPRSKKVDPRQLDDGTLQSDFDLTADLTLRLNFPNDIYQEPYPNVLDSNGQQTNQTWQEAVSSLASHIILYQNSISSIVLIGHTDEKADEEYNLMLGSRRAEFLKEQLVKRGIPAEMLITNSAGETRPLARRSNESVDIFHARCRRVEIRKILRD